MIHLMQDLEAIWEELGDWQIPNIFGKRFRRVKMKKIWIKLEYVYIKACNMGTQTQEWKKSSPWTAVTETKSIFPQKGLSSALTHYHSHHRSHCGALVKVYCYLRMDLNRNNFMKSV